MDALACIDEHVFSAWAAKLARQKAGQQALPEQGLAHSVVDMSARDDSTPNVARGPSARKSNGFCSHCCNLGPWLAPVQTVPATLSSHGKCISGELVSCCCQTWLCWYWVDLWSRLGVI